MGGKEIEGKGVARRDLLRRGEMSLIAPNHETRIAHNELTGFKNLIKLREMKLWRGAGGNRTTDLAYSQRGSGVPELQLPTIHPTRQQGWDSPIVGAGHEEDLPLQD